MIASLYAAGKEQSSSGFLDFFRSRSNQPD
jgi:hypothetical protein